MLTETQRKEADALSRYLVGMTAPSPATADYWRAVDTLRADLDEQQREVWERMVSNMFILRCVDAGLALTFPSSPLRKRIFIMLAVLETEPSLADRFLPRDRSPFHILLIGLRGLRAVLCAVAGVLLVKWWRLA